MTRPTVTQAETWLPDALARLADGWDNAAAALKDEIDAMAHEAQHTSEFWTGAAAEAARDQATAIAAQGDAAARPLIIAAVAARDGAEQIAKAQRAVIEVVTTARSEGFTVADDGTVTGGRPQDPLLVTMAGGDAATARRLVVARAGTLTRAVIEALDRLGAADDDAAHDIDEALAAAPVPTPAATVPAGAWPVTAADVVAGWPSTGQDRIQEQLASMSPVQRQRLIDEFPKQLGNTDGVPWETRIAANRNNIAQAILDGRSDDPRRLTFYRSLLGEVDDPTGSGTRIDRQILAFDPDRSSLVELNGNLKTASSMAVLVPGLNTTIEGSAANTATARRFVAAGRGDIAMITYLGGPFPRGDGLVSGVVDAVDPRYAMNMAPRLVAFSEDVDRTVDGTGRHIPVTYIGHSYGGSILGTAEGLGMTADRTMYVAAAGAGVGIDDPDDWHNRNPHVERYAMTAPGDLITLVQGIPGGTHGADPDEMPGVVELATGNYDDGRPMRGTSAHSDVVNKPSDAWRNILGVITGDPAH